jgi:hypothetical protein
LSALHLRVVLLVSLLRVPKVETHRPALVWSLVWWILWSQPAKEES